jgi:hypothetical protein
MANKRPTIGIIGGTGDLGSGLARRWSVAGYTVGLGSRSKDKAEAAAGKLGASVRGANNVGAARAGDIVVIAVPYPNHAASLPLQSSLMSKTYLKSDHFKHDDVTHRDGLETRDDGRGLALVGTLHDTRKWGCICEVRGLRSCGLHNSSRCSCQTNC